MTAKRLLRAARRRAGQTQRELAAACGLPQATIARIEAGLVDPRFGTLIKLLRASGYDIEASPLLGQGVDRSHIRRNLELTPAERLARVAAGAAALSALQGIARRQQGADGSGSLNPGSERHDVVQ